MIVYLDIIFFINFAFDFLLLLVVNIILKRNVKLLRLLIAAFIGSLSIVFLFIKMTNLTLFLAKLLISIIMILISFKYVNFKVFSTNIVCLYICSILLGGFLYYLSLEFSYKNEGLIFYYDGMSINFIILLIFSPVILYIYIRQARKYKNVFSKIYNLEVLFDNGRKLNLSAFLDTGNQLYDPYLNKPVILVEKNMLKNKVKIDNVLFIPYSSLNNHQLLKCIRAKKAYINGVESNTSFLVGISDNKFNLDGVNCILHEKILEGIK